MERIRRLALLTTLATLLLISVGGFVRAAGAGLGCESWPKCFPWSWLPPVSIDQLPADVDPASFSFTKAWIEYVNRLLGVAIGFLILGTWWAVFRGARQRRDLLWPATAAVLLVAYQGWFGGQVVKHKLDPRLVSVHLFIALVLASLLIYIAVVANESVRPATGLGTVPARFTWLARAMFLVATVQVVVGALVRGSIDLVAAAADKAASAGEPTLARDAWIGQVGMLDVVHRKTALLLIILTLVGAALLREDRIGGPVRRVFLLGAAMILIQVIAGVALAYGGLPPAAQLVHITIGSWLIGALFWLLLVLRRQTSSAAPA